MQENTEDMDESKKIESTIAVFRNFSPEKSVGNAVIYFWESHTENLDDKEKHQATIELIYKEFDMHTCEKYEVRTGYLNRYNHLSKPMDESSKEEIEEAIIKGEQGQIDWVKRCNPELPGFKLKDWRECISKYENLRFEDCKKLIIKKIQENKEFADSFSKTVNEYAEKHKTNAINGNAYMLEELSWILSLPLLHLNKPIYLIHVGIDGFAIKALFHCFSNLQKAVKWLSPKFTTTIFENESDFLMDYRNSIHTGYSYAIENKDVVKPITIFKKENDLIKEELNLALSREINEKNMLYSIIEKLPGHVYWLNRDNVYLGCNALQAKSYGLASRDDIVGKTNREFYPQEHADILDKNNITVMDTGNSYEGEEPVIMQGKYGSYLSKKSPMFDTNGKVIGLLGISIDITDRKRATELEKQNELQSKLKGLSEQVSHDIQTPLSVLSMTLDKCKQVPEKHYIKLRNAVTSIRSIVSHLLFTEEEKEDIEKLSDPVERYILIPHSLEDRISSKQCEYSNLNISFNLVKGAEDLFIFIRGDFPNYFRMMSNLINNAVEAMEGNSGTVDIGFNLKDQDVEIYVQDYGSGMPKEIVDKILNDIPVGTTKEKGHGIGLQQIKKTIKQMNGKMLIDSKKNEGTKITLVFPRSEPPSWFVDKILLPKGALVVVLDDNKTIHDYWKHRLEPYKSDITVKYFTQGDKAVAFINSSREKNRIFLLTDYELRNQEINGLDVIEKCGLQKRSILITSCYTAKIDGFAQKAVFIKFLPKTLLDDIPIATEEIEFDKTSDANIVIIDGNEVMADVLAEYFKGKGKVVDVYYCPLNFLENLSRYNKNVKIVTDYELKGKNIDGFGLVERLHEAGYTDLYMIAAEKLESQQIPSYLNVIPKNTGGYDMLV